MKLDPFIRDYDEFMDEVAETFQSNNTIYYLDTSLLMLLVRLGVTARKEFIGWCNTRTEGSIRVPVWAAHEFHRHIVQESTRNDIRKISSDLEKKIHDFMVLALERADDEICKERGYSNRDSYVTEIRHSFSRVRNLINVTRDDRYLSDAIEEIISFVNENVLRSNLNPIIARLQETGEFRYSHLVPPGYKDKKEINRYGDVVIWEEIIADLPSKHGTCDNMNFVLLSCDEKTDWVSTASFVKGKRSVKEKPNKDSGYDVVRPHPLLVHELTAQREQGNILVLHPRFLVLADEHVASVAGEKSIFSTLRTALYVHSHVADKVEDQTLEHPVTEHSDSDSNGDSPSEDVAIGKPAVVNRLDPPSLAQLMLMTISTELNTYLRGSVDEKSHQMDTWLSKVKSGILDPFQLGRLLAELILNRSDQWLIDSPDIFERLRQDSDPLGVNRVVLGLITSAYFSRQGELLTMPKRSLLPTVFALEKESWLDEAFQALNQYLMDEGAMLPYLPSGERAKVPYTLNTLKGQKGKPLLLTEIRIGGHQALAENLHETNPRRLRSLLSNVVRNECSGTTLRSLIGDEFAIPVDLLTEEYDEGMYKWSADTGLVRLDAFSTGGLSSDTDFEEDDCG